jgi:hypothetical protein
MNLSLYKSSVVQKLRCNSEGQEAGRGAQMHNAKACKVSRRLGERHAVVYQSVLAESRRSDCQRASALPVSQSLVPKVPLGATLERTLDGQMETQSRHLRIVYVSRFIANFKVHKSCNKTNEGFCSEAEDSCTVMPPLRVLEFYSGIGGMVSSVLRTPRQARKRFTRQRTECTA